MNGRVDESIDEYIKGGGKGREGRKKEREGRQGGKEEREGRKEEREGRKGGKEVRKGRRNKLSTEGRTDEQIEGGRKGGVTRCIVYM